MARLQPNKALALMLHDLFDEPLDRRRASWGTDVLSAILRTIQSAIHRGEDVYIKGFGTFIVVTRTPNPTPNNYLTHTIQAKGLRRYSPRKYVIFEPSLPLTAMVNLDTPNFKEHRAHQRWSA